MWIIRWWRWVCGYVVFDAEGGLCERFLKRLSDDGIRLWDIRHKDNGLEATCRVRDYGRLRPAAARTGTRVRHRRQSGAYVWWRPWRHRSGLIVGAIVAVIIYMVLATRVWVIDLPPCDPMLRMQITACLERAGLHHGASIREVDVASLRMDAVASIPAIHSLSVSFEGCVAHVELRLQEQAVPKAGDDPANVVAAVDGLILSAQVTAGQSMIQVGEAVTQGELLVCGAVETERETLFRHAAATVIARTEREVTVQAARTEMIGVAGRRVEQPTLCVFGCRLPLYSPMRSEEGYTVSEEERFWHLFGTPLPLGVTWTVFTEQTERAVSFTEEQAERLAMQRAYAALAAQSAAARITDRTATGRWEGDTYHLTVRFVCEEDIARTVPLLTEQA